MPQPWINEIPSEKGANSAPIYKRRIHPPEYKDKLDFKTINTSSYYRESRDRKKNLAVISTAKQDSEDLEQYCEENIFIMNSDETIPPKEYGVNKNVHEALTDKRMINNLERINVRTLNSVQQKSLRVIRDGEGVVVEAPTGIGKTYAFLIPAIERSLEEGKRISHKSKPSPTVLIIAPTGTLVQQLYNRCELILGLKDMDGVEPIHEIKIDMLVAEHRFSSDRCDIAFCTMGKLKSCIHDNSISLNDLKMVILDEADKMIDSAAFGLDITWILDQLEKDVMRNLQSCFFSATYLRDLSFAIQLTPLQMKMLDKKPWKLVYLERMAGYITQEVIKIENDRDMYRTPWMAKICVIKDLIDKDLKRTACKKEGPYKETITIFCETVGRVAQVATALRILGYNFEPVCRTITKTQQHITLNDLEFKKIQGIVCTNVLARGIDVSSVKHTIIMEMSTDFDTYKHRIGRVGRDGSGGKATVLVNEEQLRNGQFGNLLDALYRFMEGETIPDWLEEWFKQRNPVEYE